jgi:hypothetical protein
MALYFGLQNSGQFSFRIMTAVAHLSDSEVIRACFAMGKYTKNGVVGQEKSRQTEKTRQDMFE